MCATFNVISFSTIDVYIITCRTFTLNMIDVLKFVSFSYIMYLVLRHVGGSRDSGTGCALVGVSRYNFTNVYFCIHRSPMTSQHPGLSIRCHALGQTNAPSQSAQW